MAIHVHELHVAHGEGARRCIIKNIKLEHAKAKIQLFPKGEVLIVEGPRRIFVQPPEHRRPTPALGLLVAIVGPDELQLIKAELWRRGAATRQRRQPEQQQAER